MPLFTGVANSLSIYKNLHTMVAAKAAPEDGVVMGQGPFSMKYFLCGPYFTQTGKAARRRCAHAAAARHTSCPSSRSASTPVT